MTSKSKTSGEEQSKQPDELSEAMKEACVAIRETLQAVKDLRRDVDTLAGRMKAIDRLEAMEKTLNGFTNDGSSFSAYQIDPMTMAYIQIMGPAIASALVQKNLDLVELMRGATVFSRRILEELSAYRSSQEGLDYLADQMATYGDLV